MRAHKWVALTDTVIRLDGCRKHLCPLAGVALLPGRVLGRRAREEEEEGVVGRHVVKTRRQFAAPLVVPPAKLPDVVAREAASAPSAPSGAAPAVGREAEEEVEEGEGRLDLGSARRCGWFRAGFGFGLGGGTG